jgi:hypothetical protein
MAKRIIDFREITLRKELSSRGGGIEIDLTTLGFKRQKMSAYQNYLGGGLLSSIQSSDTIRRETLRDTVSDAKNKKLDAIADKLMRYMHNLTNPDTEWEGAEFENLQKRSASAY